MQADVDASTVGSGAPGVVAAEPSRRDLVRCGAELVGLSERFYGGLFAGGVVFVGLAALAALVLLPLRHGAVFGGALPAAVVATSLLVVAMPLAVWRVGAFYRVLRRRRGMEAGMVLVAALLVAYPMRSQLWWPSCAILMLLAIVVPLRRVLTYCLVALATSLASHAVAGDLHELSALAIVGLCIGYTFWSAAVSACTERLAAYLLLLNTSKEHRPWAPRRVASWPARPPAGAAHSDKDGEVAPSADPIARTLTRPMASEDPAGSIGDRADDPTTDGIGTVSRLTARQLQVVALLADGLRYREVAACLSISPRQVQRHVAQAATRLGVHGAYELTAVAVSEGMVPDPTRR